MRFFLLLLLISTPLMGASRFSFFGGLSGGYSHVQTDIGTEADKDGFHFDIEGLASYRLDPIVVDLGLGWIFNRVSGSSGVIVEDTIETYGPFVDLAARYAWGDHWQFGAASKTAFGTEVNFGGSQDQTNLAIFMGPQVAYEYKGESLIYRFLFSAVTDLNIRNRQVYMALAGFQLGLPLKENIFDSAASASSDEKKNITIDLGIFGFEVGSSKISPHDKDRIQKIAEILKKYRGDWDSILIGGHTDERGSEHFNQVLSTGRAVAVKGILVAAGLASSAISAKGFSFHQPKVSGVGENIWSQNRRVEITLLGSVKASIKQKIMKEIAELQ